MIFQLTLLDRVINFHLRKKTNVYWCNFSDEVEEEKKPEVNEEKPEPSSRCGMTMLLQFLSTCHFINKPAPDDRFSSKSLC